MAALLWGLAPAADVPGLRVQYFDRSDLARPVADTVSLDMSQPQHPPAAVTTPTQWSALWTGYVTAPNAGSLQLVTYNDDGVRLFVDGRLAINDWTGHGTMRRISAPIGVAAGQRLAVHLEYYNGAGPYMLRLAWVVDGQAEAAIPPAALSHQPGSSDGGLDATFYPSTTFSGLPIRQAVACVAMGGTSLQGPATGSVTAAGSRITAARVIPRSAQAARMVGGQFQGSIDGVFWTTLATISQAPAPGSWTAYPIGDPVVYRFVRYLAPANSYGNVAELEFQGPDGRLAGQVIGTTPARGGAIENAFDGDPATAVDLEQPSGAMLGFDLTATTSLGNATVAAIPPTNWSALITGTLIPERSDDYTIIAEADDAMRVWIGAGADPLITATSRTPPVRAQAPIRLEAGVAYPIRIEYQQLGGSSLCRLRWRGVQMGAEQLIPPDVFRRGVPATAPASTATGGALWSFFAPPAPVNGMASVDYRWATPLVTKTVRDNDLTLASGQRPDDRVGNAFGLRSTFRFNAPADSLYTLSATTDDGVQLWIDGDLRLENWLDQGATRRTIAVRLAAGAHLFDVRYYNVGGPARFKLTWRSPEFPLEQAMGGDWIAPVALPPPPIASAAGNGLRILMYQGGGFASLSKRDNGPIDLYPRQTWEDGARDLVHESTVSWQGRLIAPSTGSYRFHAGFIDDFTISLGDRPLLQSWNRNFMGADEYASVLTSAPVHLVAGQSYPIAAKSWFRGIRRLPYLRLFWTDPAGACGLVPLEAFASDSTERDLMVTSPLTAYAAPLWIAAVGDPEVAVSGRRGPYGLATGGSRSAGRWFFTELDRRADQPYGIAVKPLIPCDVTIEDLQGRRRVERVQWRAFDLFAPPYDALSGLDVRLGQSLLLSADSIDPYWSVDDMRADGVLDKPEAAFVIGDDGFRVHQAYDQGSDPDSTPPLERISQLRVIIEGPDGARRTIDGRGLRSVRFDRPGVHLVRGQVGDELSPPVAVTVHGAQPETCRIAVETGRYRPFDLTATRGCVVVAGDGAALDVQPGSDGAYSWPLVERTWSAVPEARLSLSGGGSLATRTLSAGGSASTAALVIDAAGVGASALSCTVRLTATWAPLVTAEVWGDGRRLARSNLLSVGPSAQAAWSFSDVDISGVGRIAITLANPDFLYATPLQVSDLRWSTTPGVAAARPTGRLLAYRRASPPGGLRSADDPALEVRLRDADGPILGRYIIDAFDAERSALRRIIAQKQADGSTEAWASTVMVPHVPYVHMRVHALIGGVTTASGGAYHDIPASDFTVADQFGTSAEIIYHLFQVPLAAGAYTHLCHNTRFYQDDLLISP